MRKYILPVLFLLFHVRAEAQLVKVWDQRYGGSGNEFINCMVPLANNNLLIAGSSNSGSGGDKSQVSYGQDDYWVVYTTGNGTKLWDAAFGGTNDDDLTVAIATSDGGFLMGGYSKSGIGGIKTQASQGGKDYWIVKTDATGNYLWDKRFGGSSSDFLYSLYQTSDGGYILGGFSNSGLDGDKSESSWGSDDYWVVKIDSTGTKIWDRRFGGSGDDECYSVIQTPDGGYLLGGMSSSGISGDKSQSSWGSNDYWVVKIDSAGTKIWDRRFGTTSLDYCFSACSDGSDGMVLGGYTTGGSSGDKTESSWGGYDFWIVHVDGTGTKVWDRRFGSTGDDDDFGNIYRTSDGGYLASGTSYADSISGNKTQDNLGVEQTWMVKCDAAGNYVFDRTLLTDDHEEKGFATGTNDGCVILLNNSAAGIGGDKSQSSQGGDDYFIAEFCIAGPPQADFYVPDTMLCQGQCIQYTDESIYPQTWSWSFPGGTPSSSVLQSPTICYDTTGTFDVQLIVTNMSGADTIFHPGYITVSPQIATPTILQNGNVLTSSVTASAYQWYFNGSSIPGATNQTYIAIQTGLYSVMVFNSSGCSAVSTDFDFNVNVVIANFSVSDSAFCEGSCLNFTDLSLNTPTSWDWQFIGASPSSSSSQNPSNICYNTAGIYPVTLTVINQYGQSTLLQNSFITVFALPPTPVIIQNIDTLFCTTIASSYQWYFTGYAISGATNDFYVAPQLGDYSVVITSSDGCTASADINVQFPAPMFMAQDTDICAKFCTVFLDQSTNNPVAWTWIFEAGSPSISSVQNPEVCYNVPGIFDVTLITYDGSEYDTLLLSDYITVFTTPALPTITTNGNMLTASSAFSYQWQFNSISIPGATNQTYLATQSGVYTIITTSADGCSSQVSIDFTLVGIETIFSGEEISIHPNPGNGIFILDLPEGFRKPTLAVYDVLGKEILHQSLSDFKKGDQIILDLQSTGDGVYFIRLSEDAGMVVAKIVKQKN